MSARPVGALIRWASDPVWSDPGEAWDGAATQIEPAASVKASGFLPSEEPPADRVNWLFAQLEKLATYQDAIEAQNYGEPQETLASTTALEPKTLLWLEGPTFAHLLAFDEAVYYSRSGAEGTWTAETTGSAGGVIDNGASVPDWMNDLFGVSRGLAIFVTNNQVLCYANGTWAADSHGVSQMACATMRPGSPDLWIVGCVDHPAGFVPAVVYTEEDATNTTTVDLALPSGYADANTSGITHAATSRTGAVVVVAGETANTTDVAWWRAPTGGTITWTLHRLTGQTRRVNSLFYSYEADAFYLFLDDGIFKSTDDGVSFQEISGVGIPYAGSLRHSVCHMGGVWLATGNGTPATQAQWSTDEGITWHTIIDPFASVDVASDLARPFMVRDRFALIAHAQGDTDPHKIVYSLRV